LFNIWNVYYGIIFIYVKSKSCVFNLYAIQKLAAMIQLGPRPKLDGPILRPIEAL